MSNAFDNFFINIGKKYLERSTNPLIDRYNVIYQFSFNELFLRDTEKNEVLNIIKKWRMKQQLVLIEYQLKY